MKSTRDVRGKADNFDSGDLLKKAIKLEPIKKSGKERHTLYGEIEDDDELSLESYKKRESVLDYFDDGEDDDNRDVDDDLEEESDEDLDDELYDDLDDELYDDEAYDDRNNESEHA